VSAGATVQGIGTNAFHINYQEIQATSNVPVIDIRDAIAAEMKPHGFRRMALCGTKYLFEKISILRS
jgi:aspartate/glutamate racemase